MGFVYSTISKQLFDNELVTQGETRWLCPGCVWIKYPRDEKEIKLGLPPTGYTHQSGNKTDAEKAKENATIAKNAAELAKQGWDTAPLYARSKDGLLLTLTITFTYRLRENLADVVSLFNEYGLDWDAYGNKNHIELYQEVFRRVARNVVRDIASDFLAFDFFSDRVGVQQAMASKMVETFAQSLHANINNFNVVNIMLPEEFKETIDATEIARQNVSKTEFEQQTALIAADTVRLQATNLGRVSFLRASAASEAYNFTVTGNIKALTAKLEADKEGYPKIQSNLGFNNSELLAYAWIRAVEDYSAAPKIVASSKPSTLKFPE